METNFTHILLEGIFPTGTKKKEFSKIIPTKYVIKRCEEL